MSHRLVKQKKGLEEENDKIFILSYSFTSLLVSESQEVFAVLQLFPPSNEILRDILSAS